MKHFAIKVAVALWVAAMYPAAGAADYKSLANAKNDPEPAQGEAAIVVQVEAPGKGKDGQSSALNYAPDTRHPSNKGIRFDISPMAKISTHSQAVGSFLYGKNRSFAQGIDQVHVLSAQSFMRSLQSWDLSQQGTNRLLPGKIVNHSWVGGLSPTLNRSLLRRLDYSAVSANALHVVGVKKKSNVEPLFAGAFNALVVGGAQLNVDTDYPVLDDFYGANRYRPDLVAPISWSSSAVPMVSSTAIRLNALAMKQNMPYLVATERNSKLLPVELQKALMMASAKRNFTFDDSRHVVVSQFGSEGTTPNGLDKRYGAGLLDVAAAENILLAGRFQSEEDREGDQKTTLVSQSGFDFDLAFGGKQSNRIATYTFTSDESAVFDASLVWLANMSSNQVRAIRGSRYDLTLCLKEQGSDELLAETRSTGDVSEHLSALVKKGHTYQLIVSHDEAEEFQWPYALAWRTR